MEPGSLKRGKTMLGRVGHAGLQKLWENEWSYKQDVKQLFISIKKWQQCVYKAKKETLQNKYANYPLLLHVLHHLVLGGLSEYFKSPADVIQATLKPIHTNCVASTVNLIMFQLIRNLLLGF